MIDLVIHKNPTGNVVVTSCDSIYFDKYGKYILDSFNYWGQKLHVHVTNITDDIKSKLDTYDNVTYSSDVADVDDSQWGGYYANMRYVMACYLKQVDNMFIVDFDCFLNKPIEWPDFDLGLFELRENVPMNPDFAMDKMDFIAHTTYFSKNNLHLLELISDKIIELGMHYTGAEQLAITEVCKGKPYTSLYKSYSGVASLLLDRQKVSIWQRGLIHFRENDAKIIRERYDYICSNEMG